MKNKILISLLIVSFFNYIGCYSHQTLTAEEINAGKPKGDENIKPILNNESEIEFYPLVGNISDDLFYLKVENPERIIIGTGDLIDEETKTRSCFKGMVKGNIIDSSRTYVVDSEEYSVYWTKENERLSFKKGEFIDILPEEGAGYYICSTKGIRAKISLEEIKEIQVYKFDGLNTSLLIAAILGVLVLLTIPFWGEKSITFE